MSQAQDQLNENRPSKDKANYRMTIDIGPLDLRK
jgi:hypothetical protein